MGYSFKLFFIALLTLALGPFILALVLFDREGKLAYTLSRVWTWGVLKIAGVKLRVRGLEHLNPNASYIFMANHRSNIDIPTLVQTLRRFQLRLVAKKELAWIPIFGWALWTSKHILVDRADRSSVLTTLKRARDKLAKGISVVIFPEGTRGRPGTLLPFKRGGFVLAVQSRAPVVPVTIVGSAGILARKDWRLRPGEIDVIISEPIPIDQMKDSRALLDRVRGVISSNLRDANDSRAPDAGVPLQLALRSR